MEYNTTRFNAKQYKAIVDIRLRPRCALPSPPSRPIGHIACAQYFPDSYLRLPGILSDPFCCMTLLAIEWSFCSERGSVLPMLLNVPDNRRKLFLPVGGSAPPHLIHGSLGYRQSLVFFQNGMSIGSAVFAQLTVECPTSLQCAKQ